MEGRRLACRSLGACWKRRHGHGLPGNVYTWGAARRPLTTPVRTPASALRKSSSRPGAAYPLGEAASRMAVRNERPCLQGSVPRTASGAPRSSCAAGVPCEQDMFAVSYPGVVVDGRRAVRPAVVPFMVYRWPYGQSGLPEQGVPVRSHAKRASAPASSRQAQPASLPSLTHLRSHVSRLCSELRGPNRASSRTPLVPCSMTIASPALASGHLWACAGRRAAP